MRHISRVIVVVLLVAGGPAAQQKPNFSGEWVLNRQESTLPPPVASVESGVVRIEHREPAFTFHRSYVIGGASRAAQFARETDGRELTEPGAVQGVTTTSMLRWDGPALVLAMRIKGPGFEATNDVRYELVSDGRRLRATEQGRSPQGNHDAVWIYDRR